MKNVNVNIGRGGKFVGGLLMAALAGGFGAAVSSAATVEVDDDYIAGGPGCPEQNLGVYPVSDKSLSLYYRQLAVQLDGSAPFERSICTVSLDYNYTGDRQFAVKKVTVYPTKALGSREGTIGARISVSTAEGSTELVRLEWDVTGKGVAPVSHNNGSTLEWGPCLSDGAKINYATEARVTGKDGDGESLKIRYIVVSLTSRPC